MSLPAVNDCRTARVAELLTDFQSLQRHIATAPAEPANLDDYYTEGWAALHECAANGRHILECAADTTVPVAQGGAQEQTKAELKQCVSPCPGPPPLVWQKLTRAVGPRGAGSFSTPFRDGIKVKRSTCARPLPGGGSRAATASCEASGRTRTSRPTWRPATTSCARYV